MLPAARKGDVLFCPDHGGAVIEGPCCFHVRIGGAEAARVGDGGHCGKSGGIDTIRAGNPTVKIAGEPAAGMLHGMSHGGWVATGCGSVFIGQPITDANGDLVPAPPECSFVWRGIRSAPDNMDRHRSPVAVRQTGAGQWMFPGSDAPGEVTTHEVTVRGRRIVVVVPAGLPPEQQAKLPSVAEIAAALGGLSDEQLESMNEIIVSPHSNPDDDYWKKAHDDPGHTSAAAAGGRRVTIFPQYNPGQIWWDRLFQHEAGHLVWQARPEIHDLWEAARRADRRNVSAYGANDDREDFAEAVLMYSLVKGTPCEAAMRAAFPHRFAILEMVFRQGFPKGKK